MACSLLSPDELLCCICLDVFTDPVTVPCGHNFCKSCITRHWTVQNTCPMCRRAFNRTPELHVNARMSKMARQLRQSAVEEISVHAKGQRDKAGDVPCDVCTDTKLKAVKSCLVCLTSYCDTHLEPHHKFPGLKRHQLMDPVKNLEDRLCKELDKPLELFCKIQNEITIALCFCRKMLQ